MKHVIAEDIAYYYKEVKAVDHISFDIDEGEVLGFLGPNGAGKSTTLKMLTGLLMAQTGVIKVLGQDIRENLNKVQRDIGVCFEEKNLYDDMSAAENLRFFGSLFGIKVNALQLLQRVGLPVERRDLVGNFSKGMKQRLMVARSLVNRPKVIFLDEPTDGLDPVSSKAIRKVITEEKERGASIFLTTHDMMEADKLSDRVAFINEGKIAALDTPDRLKHQYGKRTLSVRYKENGKIKEEELSLEGKNTAKRIEELVKKFEVHDMHTKEATLEDIFIQITGRRLE